ncbi:hypothetical protein DIPPA_62377 [Diplonema papillatum]|nr:hypothetical protein DIPPA_62377 [Diplonema papillatum]
MTEVEGRVASWDGSFGQIVVANLRLFFSKDDVRPGHTVREGSWVQVTLAVQGEGTTDEVFRAFDVRVVDLVPQILVGLVRQWLPDQGRGLIESAAGVVYCYASDNEGIHKLEVGSTISFCLRHRDGVPYAFGATGPGVIRPAPLYPWDAKTFPPSALPSPAPHRPKGGGWWRQWEEAETVPYAPYLQPQPQSGGLPKRGASWAGRGKGRLSEASNNASHLPSPAVAVSSQPTARHKATPATSPRRSHAPRTHRSNLPIPPSSSLPLPGRALEAPAFYPLIPPSQHSLPTAGINQAPMRFSGTVKNWVMHLHYGFISCRDLGRDIYAHSNGIRGTLIVNREVSFQLGYQTSDSKWHVYPNSHFQWHGYQKSISEGAVHVSGPGFLSKASLHKAHHVPRHHHQGRQDWRSSWSSQRRSPEHTLMEPY